MPQDILKQTIYLLAGSIIIILGLHYVSTLLGYVGHAYLTITQSLAHVFSGGNLGRLIQHVLALFIVPIIFAAIPGFIYYVFSRKPLPYLLPFTWGLWITLSTVVALHHV